MVISSFLRTNNVFPTPVPQDRVGRSNCLLFIAGGLGKRAEIIAMHNGIARNRSLVVFFSLPTTVDYKRCITINPSRLSILIKQNERATARQRSYSNRFHHSRSTESYGWDRSEAQGTSSPLRLTLHTLIFFCIAITFRF